ncbi:hypothetical protein GDO81_010581 [Engystomops pustulosus]|uniref:Uncharacterized protein n=1 Tax=Engystomops pustulosus TaxID=76066 RepID=A0AAV7C163_ENGPU|nr:hypothetical protein GDO81_010581 [Engystomops pustulosus]
MRCYGSSLLGLVINDKDDVDMTCDCCAFICGCLVEILCCTHPTLCTVDGFVSVTIKSKWQKMYLLTSCVFWYAVDELRKILTT